MIDTFLQNLDKLIIRVQTLDMLIIWVMIRCVKVKTSTILSYALIVEHETFFRRDKSRRQISKLYTDFSFYILLCLIALLMLHLVDHSVYSVKYY